MKNRICILTLFLLNSTSAFANPFENFVGTYTTEGDGTVQNDNMIECYWMYFNGIEALNIAKKNDETYTFALTTTLRGSPLSTAYELTAYHYAGNPGVVSTSAFSGDANTAIYQVARSAPQVNEVANWAITQKDGKYRIALTYRRNAEACRYETELTRQPDPIALAPYFEGLKAVKFNLGKR